MTANFLAALVSDRLLCGTKIRPDDVEIRSRMGGTAMPDHHSIRQDVITSKTVLKRMGKPSAARSMRSASKWRRRCSCATEKYHDLKHDATSHLFESGKYAKAQTMPMLSERVALHEARRQAALQKR